MKLYVKLAWRNLFRNKRRTFIAGIAIGIGLGALIFTDALIVGMEEHMIHSATASFLGEGQIHRQGFRDSYEAKETIANLDDVAARLSNEPIVSHFTIRTMNFAMMSSPANVSGISMVGINPVTEQYLSQVDEAVVEGTYFEGESEHDVLIGSKLAEILEVGLGDRVVLTTTEAHTGNLSQAMFRISGIYHFNVEGMDRAMAFVRLPRAQQMLNLVGQAHEIAVKFTDPAYGRDRSLPFWDRYSSGGNEALGWTDLLPQLEVAFELTSYSTWLMGIILFAVVALGIINILFMSLYERMFEFGVLRAIGTRPLSLFRLILLEAGSLAVVSIVMGVVLGFVVTFIFEQVGIDYTGIEFAGVTIRELLYPRFELEQYIYYPIWVFILTTLIGVYPAAFAARMRPVEAMRRSL
jgi:ABC-type lipoprotein release transport system permease subunit